MTPSRNESRTQKCSTNLLLFLMWWIYWLFCNVRNFEKKFSTFYRKRITESQSDINLQTVKETNRPTTKISGITIWNEIKCFFLRKLSKLISKLRPCRKHKCLKIFPLGFSLRTIVFVWNIIRNRKKIFSYCYFYRCYKKHTLKKYLFRL